MMKTAKKSLALVMALVLCLSLLTGIVPEAQAATYTYNWGQREDTATTADFTRSTAEEWYTKYNTSYEALAQLSGSKTQSSVPSSALYRELKSLMTNAHSYKTSYEATKNLYQYTDCQNGGGKISSFYSGNAIGPAWGQGSWNREHTWPNSKGLGGQDENDIMMLRPTSTSENSSRGNTAYGERYYDPNSESGGKYNLHGDVARICLYVYVRWGNTSYMWGASGVMESREVLLKWMEEDPVDTWELGRNDAVQSITGTRNVFVDYPELGFLLFGEDVPAGYESPSGSGAPTSYTINATSNNTSYGTVSLSGKTITATPKTGYYVAGYTVTSGTAQVLQNGNTFQVIPSSNCSVRINFAAKSAVQMQFSENGVTAKTVNAYAGDSLTLPSNTNSAPAGYTFLGWMDAPLAETTQKPTFLKAGTTVSATNKTYYALYTYAVGGTGSTSYTKTDIADIKPGDAFVITMTKGSTIYALPNTAASTGPTPGTVTAADGKLTGNVAANLLWNLGGSTNAWEFYPNGETSRWLSCTSANNGVRVDTGSNKTFKVSGTYLFNNGTSRYLGVYETKPDWRCYTSSSINIGGQTLAFYVKGESGIAYYTSGVTGEVDCYHEDSYEESRQEPTCTQIGYTAGFYCNDCESYISGHEEIPALGHAWSAFTQTVAPTCTTAGEETSICSRCKDATTRVVAATGHRYSSVVTPPTATEQGYTTYTCGACGHSYVTDYTDPVNTLITITKQPEHIVANNKETVTLTIAAEGNGLKYQWYRQEPGTTTWTAFTSAASKTANFTFTAYDYNNGRAYQCIITDEQGNQLASEIVTLTVRMITKQPTSQYAKPGESAKFTVNYSIREGVQYQWQFRYATDPETTWRTTSQSGNKTDTLTFKATGTNNGYFFRCVITDGNQQFVTDGKAHLWVQADAAEIQSATTGTLDAVEGYYVFLNVTAQGEGMKYYWQASTDGGKTFYNCTSSTSANTANFRVIAYNYRQGYMYRCAITTPNASDQNVTYTDWVTLNILPGVEITQQPQSVAVAPGETATFTVKAQMPDCQIMEGTQQKGDGSKITYKWQRSKTGTSWTYVSSYDLNTLTITATEDLDGYYYRCIIFNDSDQGGGYVASDPAQLKLAK